MTMTVQMREGLPILSIQMARAASPVAVRSRYYRRVGNSTREIPDSELPRFLLERTGQSWDELPTEFGVDAVSEKTMADFRVLARERLPEISPSDTTKITLDKLNLTVSDNRLKRAGLLLFGQNPQILARTAYVQIGRFGDAVTILDEKAAVGNLLAQLEQTMQAIRGYVFVRYDIPKTAAGRSPLEDLQRHEVWDFPYDAVREAVLNALVHRDYASVGRIQIRVYDDRLVISNPGSLTENLTVSDLFKEHNSFPRNPAIAQTIYYTQLIEKWGTGTIRMRNACRAEGAPDPEFEARPSEFIVTLRKSRLPRSVSLSTLTAEERQILEWANGRVNFTVSECMDALDMTRRHTRYLIQRLVQRGMLMPQGENRQRRYHS
jgi:ATP-dependent DNA helicase RecG